MKQSKNPGKEKTKQFNTEDQRARLQNASKHDNAYISKKNNIPVKVMTTVIKLTSDNKIKKTKKIIMYFEYFTSKESCS